MTTAAPLIGPPKTARAAAGPDLGRPPREAGSFGRWHGRIPALAGLLCLLTGVVDVVDALTPALDGRLPELSPLVSGAAARAAASAVTGLLLVLLAGGLRRRKRRAHVLVCALLTVSIGLHLVKGLDVEEAAAAGLLLALLVCFRGCFGACGDPRTRWRGVRVGALLLAASIGIGVGGLNLPWVQLVGHDDLLTQVRHALFGLVGVAGPVHFAATAAGARAADLIGDTLVGLGALTALLPIYLVLRPATPIARLDPAAESRLRGLLDRQGGRDSLGYFALRRDKSLVWSPSGKSAVAYRVVGGIMLASGDPVGDAEAWPGAIREFLAIAAEHAWTPAVMGCGEQAGSTWARQAWPPSSSATRRSCRLPTSA